MAERRRRNSKTGGPGWGRVNTSAGKLMARPLAVPLVALLALAAALGPHAVPAPAEPATDPTAETVVLLHGLGRTWRSMEPLAERLTGAGYRVVNFDYPSRQEPMEELARRLGTEVAACCAEASALHFVTHSLGGILVRLFLEGTRPANLGRVVMLSPPNQGSEVVDALGDSALFEAVMGPAGQVLGTGPESLPRRLGAVDFELGVITGNATLDPWFSWLLPGEDDGKVSVESARVEGMRDFLVLPVSHPFIMADEEVARQVLHFLARGRFDHRGGP